MPNNQNHTPSKLINYITFLILAFITGVQIYNLYKTRNDSFSGVWIVRSCLILLIISFLGTFVMSAFVHRFTMDQLPACTTIQYFRFRWYLFIMAIISLSAIPVYVAILGRQQKGTHNSLMILFASQIQVNLFTVLLTIAFDSISRYFYRKQSQDVPTAASSLPAGADANHQQTNSQNQNTQFGYFSPKAKGTGAPLSPQKNPFDSGKFRYAR